MISLARFPLVLAVLAAASPAVAQTSAGPAHTYPRTIEYQFGYNTKVASQGNGTGTTTIVIVGPSKDGGMTISGTDYWWNTARPRATNTCDVHPNGGVSCSERPYAISPMQLTLFPLFGHDYFKGLSHDATSSWTNNLTISAAIVPGATGFAGMLTTWKCVFNLQGKGPIAGGGGNVLIHQTGTLDQQGGTFRSGTEKANIVYRPSAHIPLIVDEVRTHYPQRSVYNNDAIGLKILKDSWAP